MSELTKKVKSVVNQYVTSGEVLVNNGRITLKTSVGVLYLYAIAVLEEGKGLCRIIDYAGMDLSGKFV